jgi:hypothetical protein
MEIVVVSIVSVRKHRSHIVVNGLIHNERGNCRKPAQGKELADLSVPIRKAVREGKGKILHESASEVLFGEKVWPIR